jgi:two-component system chemotaxis response regulator CheY
LARKILLADDSVTAQNMGRKILADAGYEVVTVNNGSAALKKIAEWKPELIILDVYMPGYSGLEVCQRLKDAQETARVPVLLSVGKLEPFKPDEARRVRADGYIVKPFEASELLSALSKLEDKIVPKAEAGKPGRLGRSVAGIGDSNSTSDEPVAEGSWKSRISLPGKKKETAEESPDAGDIYNSVNRDLKTVVAHDEAKKQIVPSVQADESQAKQDQSKAVKSEDKLVDLGALATAGLPKDVTTEEINALAAAVAQVQGKRGEVETALKPAAEEIKAEEKVALPEPQPEVVAAQSKQESSAGPATPTEEEVLAAIARLEQEQERGPEPLWNPSLADGAGKTSGEREDLPVTMAAPAMAQSSEGSRWTAVSVAVDPQEAALSLERAMQQAFRDFTSAAAEQAGPATLMAEAQTQPSEISAATIPAATPEAVTPEATTAEAVTESLPAVDSATEVKAEQAPAVSTEVSVAASGVEVGDFAVARGGEIPDHSSQPDYATEGQTVQSVSSENLTPETAISDPVYAVSAESQTPETVGAVSAEAVASQKETRKEEFEAQAEQAPVAASSEVTGGEATVSDVAGITADTVVETQAEPAVAEAPASEIAVVAQAEVTPEAPPNNESEMVATTAAAWASWRQIRDSTAVKSQSASATEVEHTQESAPALAESALAVAAGAEATPSEATASAVGVDSQEVASIVDNLLAELRPRIVEEISRKLAAKK